MDEFTGKRKMEEGTRDGTKDTEGREEGTILIERGECWSTDRLVDRPNDWLAHRLVSPGGG